MSQYIVSNVSNAGAGSLRQAIINANADPGSTIVFDAALQNQTIVVGPTPLPAIMADMTIDAGARDVTISGNNTNRIFFVHDGNVSFLGLNLINGKATGGAGADGGGMGAGGAIFVNDGAAVALGDVAFSGSAAIGGNGGAGGLSDGGGGGGLGGSGGAGGGASSGGGGGGGYSSGGGGGGGGGAGYGSFENAGYNAFGWREGRDPSVHFDTTSYLAAYPDVAADQVNPLLHYLQSGLAEGRQAFADGVWG